MMHLTLRVRRLHPKATLPSRGSMQAAGYDLSACLPGEGGDAASITLAPGQRCAVPTALTIAIPIDTYARVAPRSGLAFKAGIDVMAGVVDADYRGEVKVILVNLGDTPFTINHGDRIAQLILERIVTPGVEEVQDLDATERGSDGFGSTGVTTPL